MKRTFRGGLLIGLAVAVAVAAAAIAYQRYDTRTLKRTIGRGEVLCGVNAGLPGFSIPDDKGNWTGFDVDFCRAIAAAIFDDPQKAKFIPLDANERFKELQSRKVDILSRNSTCSMSSCARPRMTCISRRWLITTAKDSCCHGREISIRRWASMAARYACNRKPPRSSISPIISAPTT